MLVVAEAAWPDSVVGSELGSGSAVGSGSAAARVSGAAVGSAAAEAACVAETQKCCDWCPCTPGYGDSSTCRRRLLPFHGHRYLGGTGSPKASRPGLQHPIMQWVQLVA